MLIHDLKLNKKQFEFFTSPSQQTALTSGLGGGKSFILNASFIFNEVIPYPNTIHCAGALSVRQLKDVTLPYIEFFLDMCKVRYSLNRSDLNIQLKNKEQTLIHLRSQDMADKVRSVEYGSIYIEEMSYWDEASFKTFLGRLRNKNGSLRLKTVFTPNGLNHAYRYWIEDCNPNRNIIYTSTYENKHLPASYIKMLEDSYDSELQKQELKGEFFESNAQQIYYMFRREKNVTEFSEKQPTFIGNDFNVNPMCGVIGFQECGKLYIQDEIYLQNSNTYVLREVIKELVPYYQKLDIIADSTGDSRRTSSLKTDHQLLREAGLNVVRFRNPSIGDRYNAVNAMLEQKRIIIHPRCKMLIKDLEKLLKDNKDASLSHISDALGYAVWHYFPLKRDRKSDTIFL